MPNNRDYWQIELRISSHKLHNDEFNSKKSKQEKEKVSYPLQIHSVTEYLLSRTRRDRMHRVQGFCCLTTYVQSTLARRGGILKSIGVPPKPSPTSFFTIKPRLMHEVIPFYFVTDRFAHNMQTFDAWKKLFWTISEIVDQQTGDQAWKSKLDTSSICSGVGILAPTGSNFRRFMPRLPQALWQTGFSKLSRLNFSERLRFMSGRIQVARCPVTLRLSLTGVCKSDCVFQMCCCGTFFEWRTSLLACSRCVGLNL